MFTRRQIERLNRSRVRSIRAHFTMLKNSVSQPELKANGALREQLAKIVQQLDLIEELNRSFERQQFHAYLSPTHCPFSLRENS